LDTGDGKNKFLMRKIKGGLIYAIFYSLKYKQTFKSNIKI